MLETQESEIDNYFTQAVNYIYEKPFEFATKTMLTSVAIVTGTYMIPIEVSLPNLSNSVFIKSIIEYISNLELTPTPDEREFNPEDYINVFV
jgi:protein-arginine kinase